MTGFGKASLDSNLGKISIELKSLNSKNIDINFNIPSLFKSMENDLRVVVSNKIKRGKVDCKFNLSLDSENFSSQLNHQIIRKYIIDLKKIVNANETELLKIAIKLPDALKIIREEIDKEDKEKIYSLTIEVIDKVIEYRIQEGKSLEKDFKHRINKLEIFLKEIKLIDQERKEKIIIKLRQGLSQISQEIDENRFEQELIYYLEKYDITEEKVRLSSHLNYFKEIMEKEELNGKKLGFIAQELGREINTIGSKANHSELQKIVVKMKDDLEKIKEQLLNVL